MTGKEKFLLLVQRLKTLPVEQWMMPDYDIYFSDLRTRKYGFHPGVDKDSIGRRNGMLMEMYNSFLDEPDFKPFLEWVIDNWHGFEWADEEPMPTVGGIYKRVDWLAYQFWRSKNMKGEEGS